MNRGLLARQLLLLRLRLTLSSKLCLHFYSSLCDFSGYFFLQLHKYFFSLYFLEIDTNKKKTPKYRPMTKFSNVCSESIKKNTRIKLSLSLFFLKLIFSSYILFLYSEISICFTILVLKYFLEENDGEIR